MKSWFSDMFKAKELIAKRTVRLRYWTPEEWGRYCRLARMKTAVDTPA